MMRSPEIPKQRKRWLALSVRWSPRVRSLALVGIVATAAILLGGCSALYPPNPATDQGHDILGLYSVFMIPMAGIFLLVEGLIVWSVLRYRRRKGDDELPVQTHGNSILEFLWTALPTLLVLVLFVLSWQTLNTVDARSADPAYTIDVTGFQWQWTFDYGNGVSFTGLGDQGPVMYLPVGQTVHIRLHSNNVIHSFYVPDFLFKRDVIPGQTNSFDLKVDQPGTYSGQCAQLCGIGHYQMRFTVVAESPADFETWLVAATAKAKATPLPVPSGQPGASIQLGASGSTTFDETSLSATAGKPFSVVFTNRSSNPHDFAVKDASGKVLFTGMPIANPGQAVTYSVPALPAGTYTFFCVVHPTTMQGTLTVR